MQTETPPAEAAEPSTAPPPRRRLPRLDPLLAACALVLVAFPFAATLGASGQPVEVREEAPPIATERAGAVLREVPVFTPGGAAAEAVADGALLNDAGAMRRALDDALELFPPRPRAAFKALLARGGPPPFYSEPAYPFRWPEVDAILDDALPEPLDERRSRAASDLGGLLVLGAVRHPYTELGSAPLAFAVLDRARAGRECLAQLNLAFLLSTHDRPRDAVTRAEYRRAAKACPDDPTPLWLLGQYSSRRAYVHVQKDEQLGETEVDEIQTRDALGAFRELQRRFPRSSAGWAGEADAKLLVAYQLRGRPFTARSSYRRALALYRHARSLDPDPELTAGEARAYAGLGEYGSAAQALRTALAAAEAPAPLAAALVEYLERALRFGAAAAAAAALEADPRFPRGPALYPRVERSDGIDASEPLSLGSGRLLAVSLDVAPIGRTLEPGGATVSDLSFIPDYRSVDAVTGHDPWCAEWSRRRDLVLAGRPRQALTGFGESVGYFRVVHSEPEFLECPSTEFPSAQLLAGVAELEAGDREAAVARLVQSGYDTGGRPPLVVLLDARQNLWRFARDLERAGRVTSEWTRVAPGSRIAFDRAGEVAFLDADYGRAARLFGVAARLARSASGAWTAAEAEELLKRGTALAFARRHAEALTELREADDVASRVHAIERRADGDTEVPASISYNARLQSAEVLLRLRRYQDALEQYEAARGRDLYDVGPRGGLRRPEVLHNNEALVRIQLGSAAAALVSLRRALDADPLNPIFLQNRGFALRKLGRLDASAAAYQAALTSDPTLYPAWNDLGVVLARQGRLERAVAAFRRAVGAEPSYALGWFNLGVALERRGLRHAVAAEGAYGRAFRADPDLRGHARTFVPDDDTYFTTLDLSRPLPPKWEFARAQERTPVAVAGLALALLFGLQFGRTALTPGLGRDARRWLELGRDALAKLPGVFTSVTAWAAVGVTLIVFLLPLLRSGEATLASVLLLGLGVLALVAVVLRSRVLVARRAGITVRQRGWTPGMAVGLGAAAFGLGWAPLPVVESDRPVPAVHWIGPLTMGVAALGLLALGVGLEVPTTRALGTAALVMTASLLTPLEPLDGGYVAKGAAGLAAGLAVLAAAVFFLLGLA